MWVAVLLLSSAAASPSAEVVAATSPSAEEVFARAGFPIPAFMHGAREPRASFQKSREEAFANTGNAFFDWYYVYVRDVQERKAWGVTIAMTRCANGNGAACLYENAWGCFLEVLPGQAAAQYVERWPLSAWNASTTTQQATITGGAWTRLSIASDGPDGSHISLRGRLGSKEAVWRSEGGLGEHALQFDLKLTRRAGWFGESWIEDLHLDRKSGAIMWSPYAHQATVTGTITARGATHVLGADAARFRAYADSNWGSTMPRPPPRGQSINYPWGWYYAARPHADPAKDVSIICGAGRTWLGLLPSSLNGRLCDLRLGTTLRLSLWAWTFDRLGGATASWASDGGGQKVNTFDIRRSDWADWADAYGTARVPMRQELRIATGGHRVELNYTAARNTTARLLFALQDDLFSDFETLGATVSVRVVELASGREVLSFVDPMGGLEFGYRVPVKVPPSRSGA